MSDNQEFMFWYYNRVNEFSNALIASMYKELITEKVTEHIKWLHPQDHLQRATSGYEGMLHFMNSNDNSHLLKEFFRVNDIHDTYRKERFEDTFTEYKDLRNGIA